MWRSTGTENRPLTPKEEPREDVEQAWLAAFRELKEAL